MSNTVNLDDYEKLNFLFKNYLGFPNTDKTKPFFLETAVKANNYLFGGEIFLDTIPLTPDFDSGNGTNHNANSLNIDSNKLNASDSAIHTDSTNVVRRFTKIKLEKISGTQRGYYCLDQNNINILKDALQFNVNKADDGTQPYLYKLYTNSGVNSDEQILPNSAGGNWIFDVKNGVVNFPDTITGYNVSESSPPYLTFYKYVGRKGINQLSTSDIVGLGNQIQNIQLEITELSGNILDISNNIYRKSLLDISFNQINKSVTDLSDNVYSKALLDNSFNKINKNVTDLSNNVYSKALLDNSFNKINKSVTDISDNVYSKAFLDNSFNQINKNVTDLSNNVYSKAFLDNSFNQINKNVTDLSDNVYSKAFLDNSFNKINKSVTDLSNNVYSKAFLDNSFNKINKNVTDLSYNVYSKNVLDNSFNKINKSVSDLSDNVYSKAFLDNSFNKINKNVTDLSDNVYSKNVLDNSFNKINKSVSDLSDNVYSKAFLDNSFNQTNKSVSDLSDNVYSKAFLDNSFNQTNKSVSDLSNNVYSKNVLDNSFNQTNKSVTDLSNNVYSKAFLDNSFKNVYTKSNIDTKFDSLESEIDVSFNDVYNKKFINDLDSSLRNYVDGLVSGLDIKQSVKAATTDASNVSLELDYNVNGPLIIDGVTVLNGDRILLKNQSVKTENGIYELSGNKLQRTNDFNNGDNVTYGSFTFVELGFINNDKGFVLTKSIGSPSIINIDNTPLEFSQFSGAGQIIAGDGLNKQGETLSVNVDNQTISIVNDKIQINNVFKNKLDASLNKIDVSLNNVYTKSEVDKLTEGFTAIWEVSGDSSGYTFKGHGLEDDTVSATLYLTRGQKYKFQNKTTGHPFQIQTDDENDGTAYNKGVNNNRAGGPKGEVIFEVPMDAPSKLWYACTNPHPEMKGVIYIGDKIHDLSNNVYSKALLDNSFNQINKSVTDLSNNVYSKALLDNSFNQINNSSVDLSNNVYSKALLDNSFNQINNSIVDLSNNIYSKSVLDNSFNHINNSIVDLSNNVYSKSVLDNSFNHINNSIVDLSNNVYSKSVLDNSFNNIYTKSEVDELTKGFTAVWEVSGDSSGYKFKGPGLEDDTVNATIYLTRGEKYKFQNKTSGHPFQIQTDDENDGTAYNKGVNNNRAGGPKGEVIFEVPMDAPSKLWYACTSPHPEMKGVIYIGDKIHDLSNNVYSKALLDNSFNHINNSIVDLSNNVYSKSVLDNSFNQINKSVTDLSNNIYSKSVLDNSFNNVYTKSEVDELTRGFTAVWEVSGDSSGYTFKGPGLIDDTVNATIYLTRGEKYKFQNKTSGHPFQIQTDDENDGTAYNKGVNNNRAGGPKGEVIFEVPMDAPSKLWYACTSPHPEMKGVIYIGDKIHDLSNNVYHKELLYNKSEIDTKVSLINSKIDLSFNKLNDNINDLSNNSYSKSEINSKIDNIKLNNLSDVNVTTVQNDQYLKYDSSTSKWVASTITTTNTGGGSSSGGSGSSAVVNNRNQTFFELLTQQPNQFTASSTSNSSSQITINWNYNDIVPTHEVGVFAKLMFPSASADRSLPHIDEIRFDVSGVNTLNSNHSQVWFNDNGSTISINSGSDYNSGTTYKSKNFPKTALSNANNSEIENILSKTSPIDIRVYGVVNNGIDVPNVNSRALVFRGLQFSQAAPPSQPIRQSVESISSTLSEFSVNYRVSQTENGVTGSSARINSITGKFTELTGNDTLVSTIITQTDAGDEQTKTTSLNLLNAGQNLPITFDNLRFGTKYTYKVSVKNNFSSTSSDDSITSTMSNFIKLPSAGSSNLILDIHTDSLKNILKPSSSLLSNIVYVNISETTGLKFANDNLQTFEVTDTSATTSSAGGVGKGVDDEDDIAQIEISKNFNGGAYTSLQLIKYSGFNRLTNTVKNVSKSTNDIIKNVSTNDKYSSDQLRKGFRIEGKFQLDNIPSNNITNLIGGASSDPYGIRLSYTRTYNTGSNQTKEVYIDNLGSDPSITKTSGETFNITSEIYTMGIASVKEFNATFNRTYNNICSQYGFIPGDGKIGEITSIAGTNKSSSATSVTITSSEIPTSTPFNKTKQTTISNVFYNTGTLLSNSKTFVVKEKAFSLKKPDGIPSDGGSDTITIKHFCDRNSYNISSNQIYSRKFNTTFYEITDTTELGKLNTNIGSIGVTEYTDHTTSIKPWTLLYIDGKLQTNNAQAYPDFSNSNFNQTGITKASTYSSGTSSYDLTGTSTGGNNNGYKWIVFKIPSNSSTYVKEASSKTGGAALPYIDVPAFIDSLPFNSTSDIKTKINTGFGSQNVVGFIRIINSNDDICIGRFTSNKVANSLWYLGGNTSSVSLSNVLANDGVGQVYGSLIDTGNHNVANGWGVECPTQSNFKSGSDIEIFIGLKNNVSL